MANLVYKRVSTDQQSTDRQNLVLDEAGIEEPVKWTRCGPATGRHAHRQHTRWRGPNPKIIGAQGGALEHTSPTERDPHPNRGCGVRSV